ncbi:MAG: hypothetical protein ACYTCU_00630 [Planctomycetota bacterium]|jgi:hypothetical protein
MPSDQAARQPPARRGILRSPFTWFVLLLLALEWLAWDLVPYRTDPTAAEVARLERKRRGWPEYVAGPSERERPLVVIISNSQGYGREMHDPADTWAGHLRESLARRDPPIDIENWSSAGLRTGEIELLSMQAVERRADLVLYMVAHRNVDLRGYVTLKTVGSDIPLLAGRPSLWGLIDDSEVGRRANWDDLLTRGFLLNSQFGRARVPVLDWWAKDLTREQEEIVLGHVRASEREPFENKDALSLTDEEMRELWRARARDAVLERVARLHTGEFESRLETLRRMHPPLQRRHDASDIPYLWIWVPTDVWQLPPEDLAAAQAFRAAGSEIIAASGGRTQEWSERVPSDQFLSLNHFTRRGHATMAELVEELIVDALP